MLPIALVAYLILFILVGVLFLFVSLLIGRFIRPYAPSVAKGEAYECGEPAVGSSFIQFDLRFYVVALLFIIFEVELAFFFPPAVVFGKLNQLRSPAYEPIVQHSDSSNYTATMKLTPEGREKLDRLHISPLVISPQPQLNPAAKEKFAELSIPAASVERMEKDAWENGLVVTNSRLFLKDDLEDLAMMAMLDMGVFFLVLLVGFAFLWKQGDLNWVRATARLPAPEKIKLALVPQHGEGR